MDALGVLTESLPLLAVTVVAGWLLNGRLTRLERKVDGLPTREEFNALVHRVDRHDDRFDRVDERFDRLDAKIDALRADLTQIAIALGTQTRPQAG